MKRDALTEAIDRADLPALVAEMMPDSGARPGRAGDVRCVWRGEETTSGSLHKSKGGAWLLTDHGAGETYNAMRFLTDVMQSSKKDAADEIKRRWGASGDGEAGVTPSKAQRPTPAPPARKPGTDALGPRQAELRRDGLPPVLLGRGLSLELLLELGMGRAGDVAWLPILGPDGDALAVKRRYPAGAKHRYDFTTTGAGNPCWHSPEWAGGASVLIVEGELNAVACWAAQGGRASTVAVMGVPGAKASPNWDAVGGRRVFLLADDDEQGKEAVAKWRTAATSRGLNVTALSPLPDGADACEYAEAHSLDGLRVALAPDLHAEPGRPEYSAKSRALTDLGNAERFVDLHADKVRYVYRFKSWLVWDGTRWQRDEGGVTLRLAKETMRSMGHEWAKETDDKRRAELLKHATQSERGGRLREMVTLAESEINTTPDALDTHPMLYNVLNGTLDLRTGRLRPHERRDLLTKQAPVIYDQGAACPTWEAFLLRIMDGRAHLVDFLRRAVGYTLTGLTSEQCLFLMYGTGANGKSTFLDTLAALLGEYGTQSDFETFEAKDKSGGGASSELARLAGARMVSAVEAETGRRLAESRIKQLTGGDMVAARYLFQEFFEFRPQFKLWLAANHKPEVRNNDEGIWRRIKLIPFEAYIPAKERDPRLLDKLRAELPGILAWAVRGCLEWQADGLQVPAEVDAATQGYREDMDRLGAFLEDSCLLGRTYRATARDLYTAYEQWCESNGERPLSQKGLGMRLTERNLRQSKGAAGIRVWDGIGLITTGKGSGS